MENTKIQPITTKYSPQQLLDALYYIWDAFERSNMPFFLVWDTARQAILNADLRGDKVEVGVRAVEWRSGAKRIFDAFVNEPIEEESDTVTYEFHGVPVIVHIFEKDHECIVQTDMVRYRYEEFKVPNPYQKFIEVFGK
jgi:hypothetical protein